jgi:hypothetical protein
MPKAFLFATAAVIGFSVTVETPGRPEAGVHSDFDPAGPVEMVLNLPSKELAARADDAL